MVLKILILGKRSLKKHCLFTRPCLSIKILVSCYIKHFKHYNTKLDHAELLLLSIYCFSGVVVVVVVGGVNFSMFRSFSRKL